MGSKGYSRQEAEECALQYLYDERQEVFVAPVRINCKPDASPIDAFAIVNRAEGMLSDCVAPINGPVIDCDNGDVRKLQADLNRVWDNWISDFVSHAAIVDKEKEEEI